MTNGAKCLLYKFYSFLVYLIPMGILFFINRERYDSDGSFVGFFGYIAIFFVILAYKNAFNNLMKNKTLLTVSAVLFVFSLIMHYLAKEMMLITGVSFVGAIFQSIFQAVADVYENHSKIVIDGVNRRNTNPAIPDADAWREAFYLG